MKKPLSLNQKLKLTSRNGMLVLFDEGVFVRGYNESAYLLSQVMGKPLKPLVYIMKHKPFYTVISVSIPKVHLKFNERISNYFAVDKTDFGFEIRGDFNLEYYQKWFEQATIYCE